MGEDLHLTAKPLSGSERSDQGVLEGVRPLVHKVPKGTSRQAGR